MNERIVTDFLGKHITKERVKSLAGILPFPGAGIVVGILGGLIVRAIAAAKEYIERIDKMPIIPPELPNILTYEEAERFLKQKQLEDTFRDLLALARNQDDPSVNDYRAKVGCAATVVKKCFDGNDGLFNVFYKDLIDKKEYRKVWETHDKFLYFKKELRRLLPPADFKTMFDTVLDAVKEEAVRQIKDSKVYEQVKGMVKNRIDEVVPGNNVDMDKVIATLGNIT